MQQTATPDTLKQAIKHLSNSDILLAPVILKYGKCTISPHQNYYQALVGSIIGQQLSVKAAASIRKRFYELFGGNILPKPEDILAKSVEELRTVGLSYQKARYVQDLALHILEGRLNFEAIDSLSNEDIITMLTDVKGIGEWTAHMFIMFSMGRLDVLPVGDLGIKNGIQKLYGLPSPPSPDQIREIAVKFSWHPYESVACWYIWQSLDNSPK